MKTALITGANKGIGRQVAEELAGKGFHVFVGAREKKAGEEAVRAITKSGGKATFLHLDVADDESVQTACEVLGKDIDHLDVLVNNAGISVDGDSDIFENTDEHFQESFETNTLGALRVTRAFEPLLAKSRSPRVINVSSESGQLSEDADDSAPAYAISKCALNMVTAQLAKARPKFAINSVSPPGTVRTDMGGEDATTSVEEGAETIVWLADEAPQKLTGKFLRKRKEIDW